MINPLDLSAAALARAIAKGEITAEAAAKASLARIKALDKTLNSFIAVEEKDALETARGVDKARAKGQKLGPLAGLPLAHKDMFWRKGKVMTGGSVILEDFRPTETSTLMERLDAAGAVTVGTLNLSEWAASPTGTNLRYGTARNAWDPARIPGGSSSGSGVAVAARLVSGALGSDTGGSIRIPAALNGIVGLKPTQGRVTLHGVLPRATSLDNIGPMTRTVEDCALMHAVIAGPDPRDPTTLNQPEIGFAAGKTPACDPRNVKIVASSPKGLGPVDAQVWQGYEKAAKALAGIGFAVRHADIPDVTTYHAIADAISKSEAATIHRKWMEERPKDYARLVYDRTLSGFLIPAVRYIEAISIRGKAVAEYLRDVFGDADAVILPTVSVTTPTVENVQKQEAGDEVLALIASLTRLTRGYNYLGLPAVSIPCGTDANGMPLGFQIVGRPYAEAKILAIAAAYEKEVGFGLPARPRILDKA